MSETTWNRDTITELLATNPRAVERALVILYANQTDSERESSRTVNHNGVGFGYYDAEIFSKFARWVLSGKHLSPRMLALCRKPNKYGIPRIAKYWKQLLAAIEAKEQK